ncbi:UNVERIFIED_CONTAM: hypothetical protein QYH65_17960, partial [Kocuria sp. CPCC 205300]
MLEQALAAQVLGNIVMANVFLKAIRELDPKKQQNFGVASVEPEEETNNGGLDYAEGIGASHDNVGYAPFLDKNIK